MKYSEIRSIAKDGDIIFLDYDKYNFLSIFTHVMTGSMFTHSAFLFWYKDRLMIVESTTHGGLRVVNASVYENRELSLVPGPRPWDEISDMALQKIGTVKYGWISATYIGFRDIMYRWFNISLPQNNGNRNLACSEFVALVLGFEDIDIPPRKLHELLTHK